MAAILLFCVLSADKLAEIPKDAVAYFKAEEKYAESLRGMIEVGHGAEIASVTLQSLKAKNARPNLFRIMPGDIGFLPEIVMIDSIIDDSTCIVTHKFQPLEIEGGVTVPEEKQILIRGVSTSSWGDGERHAIRPCLLLGESENSNGQRVHTAVAVDFREIEKYRPAWNRLKKDEAKKSKSKTKAK